MTISEYTETIKKVENFYDKEYTDIQKKEIFERIKAMRIERFRYIISRLYESIKFLPKLPDILEMNRSINYVIPDKDKKESCPKCKNTGYITYWKKIKNGNRIIDYEFMSLCDCKRHKQYKGWEAESKNNYYIPYAAELGLTKEYLNEKVFKYRLNKEIEG